MCGFLDERSLADLADAAAKCSIALRGYGIVTTLRHAHFTAEGSRSGALVSGATSAGGAGQGG
jgi:hypothetical protein